MNLTASKYLLKKIYFEWREKRIFVRIFAFKFINITEKNRLENILYAAEFSLSLPVISAHTERIISQMQICSTWNNQRCQQFEIYKP